MISIEDVSRRQFVKIAGGTAGGLVLGFTLGCSEQAAVGDPIKLNAYVKIAPDETITLVNPSAEMGQGVHISMSQVLADELDVAWDQISVVRAPFDPVFNNPGMPRPMQVTAASTSARYYFTPLRQAGAAAREVLVRAAAARWGVAPSDCSTADGHVIRTEDQSRLSYGALAADAARLEAPTEPALKSSDDFKFIGRSLKSPAQSQMADGSLRYTIDVEVPNMLYAAVKESPVFGGRLKRFEDNGAAAAPGVRDIYPMENAIAVVADRWWQAKRALELITVHFEGGQVDLATAKIYAEIVEAAETQDGVKFIERGTPNEILNSAANTYEATYLLPYLTHMPMEPLACVAQVTEDGAEIWTGTQNIGRSTRLVAELLNVPTDNVTVHTPFMGGSFGRRLGFDLEVRAADISRRVGQPVKVIWSREEATRHGSYRAVVGSNARVALDDDGLPTALDVRVAQPPWPTLQPTGLDPYVMLAFIELPYDIPNVRYAYVRHDVPIPIGQWRSVQHSYTAFIMESLVDELAAHVGEDPYDYRLRLIGDNDRLRAVMQVAAEKTDWRGGPPPGRARGIATLPGYGSFIAQIVEVSVLDNKLKVHRVVSVVDCGMVINPHIVRGQIEGAMLQGLNAALNQEITIADGAIVESNFHDYPHLTLAELPEMETHILDSKAPPSGVGEVGTPAVQAALTNAIFAATGNRLRSLPVSKHGLSVS